MKKHLIPATAIAIVASMSLAYAAAETETGVISKIDATAHTITLKSGKVKEFWLDKAVSLGTLKVGDKVLVTYEITNKKPMASAVAAAQ